MIALDKDYGLTQSSTDVVSVTIKNDLPVEVGHFLIFCFNALFDFGDECRNLIYLRMILFVDHGIFDGEGCLRKLTNL